jgi:hypothetical protein
MVVAAPLIRSSWLLHVASGQGTAGSHLYRASMHMMHRLQALLFILVNLSEQLLELLGQAVDFALCEAHTLSVQVLQSNITEKDPQENA